MAQAPGARPLREARLGDQARPDGSRRARAPQVGEGRAVLPEGRQALGQVAQDGAREADADLARVAQAAVLVVAERRAESVRLPRGAVKPPITSSCSAEHLSFSQSRERPCVYGASVRLAIRPSQPLRQASLNGASPSRFRYGVRQIGSRKASAPRSSRLRARSGSPVVSRPARCGRSKT